MQTHRFLSLLALFGLVPVALAQGEAPAPAEPPALPVAVLETLNRIVPGVPPDSLHSSPITGLYEAAYGAQVIYVSGDGRYAIQGDLLDLQAQRNLSEDRRGKARMDAINRVSEKDMIVFSPASPKHTITVFTDIDCTYCRRLHNEVKQLNDLGVKVRYMAFPRAGAGSEPFSKAVSVWCAEDRQQAITDAKAGQPVPTKNCANPVQAQYEVGQTIGVRGTPAIILENGRMLPGYVPAPELVQQLDEDKTPLP